MCCMTEDSRAGSAKKGDASCESLSVVSCLELLLKMRKCADAGCCLKLVLDSAKTNLVFFETRCL
jgi:hypothetical protein